MGKIVLLIDDDPELGRLVETILRPLEITIYQSYSGSDGMKKAYEIHPDLIILDLMLPYMDGFEICERLREMTSVPVLILTARVSEADMLHSFNVGADDFVKKPFKKEELEARVRALLRRRDNQKISRPSFIASYRDSVLEVDLSTQTVKLFGQILNLSTKEYAILACLVRKQGRLVSHSELVREVWGELSANAPALASLYIHYVRNKLRDGLSSHRYIHTQWGRGYWFESRKEEQVD